jgi:hypothetical protein
VSKTFPLSPSADALRVWRRSATVRALAHMQDRPIDEVATRLFGPDGADIIARSAVNPASTTGWGSATAGQRVGAFIESLRPKSAAAQLIARGRRFDMSGVNVINMPGAGGAFPEPGWVGEGEPIPAYGATLASVALGPPKKLAALAGLTAELANLTGGNAEAIVQDLMDDAAARELDASLFSDAAASSIRPAGILNGVSALTPETGGGLNAAVGDVGNLVGAIHTSGGGTDIVLIASPAQAVRLKMLAGAAFDVPVIPAPSLVAGTVIAIEVGAFVSGFVDVPQVDIGREALIHWEDTAPAAIGTSGTPNVVAAPTRSGFQTDTYSLRLILRAAWAMRGDGLVQFVEEVTW